MRLLLIFIAVKNAYLSKDASSKAMKDVRAAGGTSGQISGVADLSWHKLHSTPNSHSLIKVSKIKLKSTAYCAN